MQDENNRLVELVIQLRKQLAAAETRRGLYQQDVPTEVWTAFVEISLRLEQAEEQVRKTCHGLAGEVNQIRCEIMDKLEQYNHWRRQMRQTEEHFLLNIVRPGYQLKLATRQREKLESEYQRIYNSIQREEYSNRIDLDADIHRVLAHDDATAAVHEEIPDETLEQEKRLYDVITNANVDDVVDVISRDEIIKEFKRVVIPKIHPDTSDAPADVFINVYEVFKKEDPLLMEAYIVKYRGEIQPETDENVLEVLDQTNSIWKRYQRVLIQLERRFNQLKEDLTSIELDNPAKVLQKLEHQRQEILDRILREAEQILFWREKIAGLAKEYSENNE